MLSWLSTLGSPSPRVAWYTGSEEDAALERFWRHVVAALRVADPELVPSPDELDVADDPARMTAALDRIILAIGERLDPDVLPTARAAAPEVSSTDGLVIVLDDLHATIGNPDVAASLQYFLRYLPAGVHVVTTSRRSLPIPLARMRVRGELVELIEDDLRLDSDGIDGLFSRSGIGLTPEDLASVGALTHGWPTGCRLVAMMCGDGSPDSVTRALARARATMGDYLFEEVLLDLPASLRSFLMQMSVVDSFCPSLACAVTGRAPDEVAACIGELLDGSLFVERVEHEGDEDWYRYQPLLSELLRARGGGPEAAGARLACQAARDWFEPAGYFDAAAELSASLGDFEAIRHLIRQRWRDLYMSDAHGVLVRWASFLPEAEVLISPYVCAVLAMPLALHGETERARRLIVHAVEHLRDNEDFLLAFCMAQQAFLASFRADAPSMRHYAGRALAYLPEDEYYLRGMMLQVQASSYMHDAPLRARELLVAAVDEQRAFDNDNLTCSALGNLALLCANMGYLDEAAFEANRAMSLYPREWRDRKPMLGYSWLALALADYARGDYESALACIAAFDRAARGGVAPEIAAEAGALRAKALQRMGDGAAAEELARALELDEIGAAGSLPDMALLAAMPAVVRGRISCRAAGGDLRSVRILGFACAALADAPMDLEACNEAGRLADGVDPDERALFVYAHVVAAVLCEHGACTQAAERHLGVALRHARSCDLSFLVAENAPQLETVLRRLLVSSQETGAVAFARELLAGASGTSTGTAGELAAEAQAPLTERETDVMRLIAAGMSLSEAAEAIVVSRETVKKHLANIYAKLGVHSKMQAVALLRERGLI